MATTELNEFWKDIMKSEDLMTLERYECGPGLCVIINNMKFLNSENHLPCGGVDQANLKDAFESIGFVVEVHPNLEAKKMEAEVKKYSEKEHTGAFFLILLSHGGEGVVYGTDEAEVKVQKLKENFYNTKCHDSLVGKPKVFVIDACRGNNKERCTLSKSKPGPSLPSKPKIQTDVTVTDSADILTIFASTRGNTADYDNEGLEKGMQSQIQKLGQTTEFESTLTKQYYIKSRDNDCDDSEQKKQMEIINQDTKMQ
uniref:Caspase family p20 domain-containing protein n=1 Tax=Amphimedon queenslandica TaxID=400682 RepID=A0A1X7T3M0_AMPQE